MHRSSRWLSWFFGFNLVAALALVACASPRPTAPTPASSPAPTTSPASAPAATTGDWDKILAAARKEGTLTVYNSRGAYLAQPFQEAMRKYGIKVESVAGTGGELELRILTEQRAKANVADVFIGGWTNQSNVAKAGFAQAPSIPLPALSEKDVWKIAPDKYDPTNMVYVTGTSITPSVVINTELVKKGEIQSWQDLLDPKWRDRIVMTDPRTGSGPGASGFGTWLVLGEDFWKKMAAQRITFVIQYDQAVNRVAFGEKSLILFPGFAQAANAIRAGAPLQIVHLKEGTTYFLNAVNIVKDALHPNAALVFVNWMFSKEGQATYSKAVGNYPVRNDIGEEWLGIPELNTSTFTLLEPPNNLDPGLSRKAAATAKSIFDAK